MIWICLALSFSGFSALSLSTERHHGQVFADKGSPFKRQLLRLLGWLLLVGAVIPGVIELGPSVGIALWAAVLSVAAGGLVILLTYRPGLIVPLAVAGPSMALAVWVF
ncbi:DUF3325 domain-containing protein [Pseudomonas bubulae]|uniref:DUF3325 domain-containing protein n=1 Tax=Pseudomonas bubulae TaxID=2316085 RepID=UPI002B1DB94F|nr:DUF3325 domain-containing protein [Pseudomonas bubulae]